MEWEIIKDALCPGVIQRSRTPTGWLVREYLDVCHINTGNGEYNTTGYDWRVALTFVPDPEGVWLKGM